MSDNNYPNRKTIYTVFPSDKLALVIEDSTILDTPKIRLAMFPTKKGGGGPVDFFMDLPVARVFFSDLALLGQLQEDALTKEIDGKSGKIKVFDLFAKIGEKGHRSLTTSNMPDGIYLKVVKNNGEKNSQAAALGSFQARVMGQAVSAYITQLDLIALASTAKNDDDRSDDEADQDELPG